MPQKINPDVLELTPGKNGPGDRSPAALLVLTKGLPLAYNRDLQEDKPAIMDAARTVLDCLEMAEPIVSATKLRSGIDQKRLEDGFLDATAMMEWLIKKGLPQRSAHHLVGELVRLATGAEKTAGRFQPGEFQQLCPIIDRSIYDVLGASNAVASLESFGSGGPRMVAAQIVAWKALLAKESGN